jgi:membrane protein implicated in regulation of membrane protease activity
MTTFAHAGHWLVQIAYLAPLVLLVVLLVAGRVRERRERSRSNTAAHQTGAQREGATATEPGPDP